MARPVRTTALIPDRGGQCLAEWWALRLIVGVYSPLSIAAIPPVSQVGFELGHGPLGQVVALA
jgi:hypothetical protein